MTRQIHRSYGRRFMPLVGVALVLALAMTSCKPLTDLKPVERGGAWSTGAITMNATDFTQAWIHNPGAVGSGCNRAHYIDFDLGRAYKRFETTVGVRDDTNSSYRYDYRILVDGVQRASGTAQLGATRKLEVSVTNGLRLRLEVNRRCGATGNAGRFAFASPLLIQ